MDLVDMYNVYGRIASGNELRSGEHVAAEVYWIGKRLLHLAQAAVLLCSRPTLQQSRCMHETALSICSKLSISATHERKKKKKGTKPKKQNKA
jgi:hypothetical protein